jgi:hypothetical protein
LNPTDGPTILYFGNDWFAENRTSSHQIARLLAERCQVFYFECPGLRAPKGSGRDLLKLFRKAARFLRGSHSPAQVSPHVDRRSAFTITDLT